MDFAHIIQNAADFNATLGTVSPQNSYIQTLGISKTWHGVLNLNHKFPDNLVWFEWPRGTAVTFKCKECGSQGTVELMLEWRFPHRYPRLQVTTRDNVKLFARMVFQVWQAIGKPLIEKKKTLVTIPLEGLYIPGVLEITPALEVDAVLSLAQATAGFGVEVASYLCFNSILFSVVEV